MNTRSACLSVLTALVLAPALLAADVIYETDFTSPDPDNWTFVTGDWEFADGALVQKDASSYSRQVAVLNKEVGDCIIEAQGTITEKNVGGFGVVGVLARFADMDTSHYLALRHGAYGYSGGAGRLSAMFGGAWTEVGETYNVKLIIANGMVGAVINGTLVGVRKDPLAGQPGKPGFYTESGVRYTRLRVTAIKD